MADSDDPRALGRALATIAQEIVANVALDGALAPDAAAKAATVTTTLVGMDKLDLRKPQTVLRWLRDARKQIAPHADKVPLPIVQGLARTVFPPAQAVVPVIRYLQTHATPKATSSSASALATVSSPAPTHQQLFIIPIVQQPPPAHPFVSAMHRTVRGLGMWAQRNPVLAITLVYAIYRARGLPGKAVRALDRAVNLLCAWAWAIALKATRKQRAWASEKLAKAKEGAKDYVPSSLRSSTVVAAGDDSPGTEGGVKLDIGDAVWVVITAIVAIYVTVNRQKIFKRR